MIIATSITESYLEKSKPFFDSVVQNFEGRRICFTIGFETTIEGWECIKAGQPNFNWRPTNRENYASLQHGEFVKYLPGDINPDDLILFLDSDMILQRKWDLQFNSTRGITVTSSSWPLNTLQQVVTNLGIKGAAKKKLCKQYNIHKDFKEFCACFIIATLDSWENIYKHCKANYSLLDNFTHHAAHQLLINVVVLNNFPKVFLLPDFVVNASWYKGTKATGNPLSVEVDASTEQEDIKKLEPVYFNHTKFN